MDQKEQNIPYQLVLNAFEEGKQDTLSYFIRLRGAFKSPIIYNYSFRGIAKILKCSPSTAQKHINIMLSEGWVREHSGHLCAVANSKLKKILKTFIIKIVVCKNKKQQLIHLRLKLFRRVIDWQKKEVTKKSELLKIAKLKYCKISKSQKRKINSMGGLDNIEKTFNPRITLSNIKIGRIFNRSEASGKRYQKDFNKEKLVKSTKHYRIRPTYLIPHETLRKLRICASVKNGLVMLRTSNTIEILSSKRFPLCNSTGS